MGTRQLRRLQAELAETRPISEDDDTSEAESLSPIQKLEFNPFDLLEDDDHERSEQEPVDSDVDESRGPDQQSVLETPAKAPPTEQRASKHTTKKRKAKSKKKQTAGAGQKAAPSNVDKDVDIDAVLQELNITPASERPASTEVEQPAQLTNVFTVRPKQLRAEQELVELFGSSVMALERQAEQDASRASRQRVRGAASRGTLRRALLLVPPNPNRRPYDGSLTMQIVGPTEDGGTEFRYCPTGAYKTATMHLEQAQASYDPNNVVAVLQRHPFHVGALLAMYDLYLATGQSEYAEFVLETALYGLECAWHPHFKAAVMDGSARLPSDAGHNGVFFSAAVRGMRAFARRGCHRTALEWCKLVLSLDRNDPAGLLFQFDYLALRSRQYDALFDLVRDESLPQQPMQMLPNFAFSLCLAEYYSFRQRMLEDGGGGATATGVHARGENLPLDAKLVNAVLTFPAIVTELVAAMQEQGAAKDAAWGSVMNRSLFRNPHGKQSATLQHLARIFTVRNVTLWKAPDVLAWLLRCCEHAAEHAEGTTATAYPGQWSLANARQLCETTYPESDGNEYQHLPVDDFGESAPALPPEQLAGLMAAEEGPVRAAQQAAGGTDLTAEQRRNANPLTLFMQTLLPWVNLGGAPGAEGGDGADGIDIEPETVEEIVQALQEGMQGGNEEDIAHALEQYLAHRRQRDNEDEAEQ